MAKIDVDEVLCQIKTDVLVDELKERLNILSGMDRKAAEEEFEKDVWRNSNFIEIQIDEENVIDNMEDDDLLEECKLRQLIPEDFIASNYLEEPIEPTIRHIKKYAELQFKPLNNSFNLENSDINTIIYDKRASI